MSHIPAISVIMPVYNTAQYLREAIDSILNQTFTDFEFIIIDDASTDGSNEIIKSYSDNRIILIENEVNRGIVYGLNYAISFAKGDYIARMDSDDISLSRRLEIQFEFLEKSKDIVLCGSNYSIIGTDKIVCLPMLTNEIELELLYRNPIAHPTVMFRNNFFKLYRLTFDISFTHAEDYDLWSRVSRVGKIYNIPLVLLKYRVHDGQISITHQKSQISVANEISWRNVRNFALDTYKIGYNDKVGTRYDVILSRLFFLQRFTKFLDEKKDRSAHGALKSYQKNLCSEFFSVIYCRTEWSDLKVAFFPLGIFGLNDNLKFRLKILSKIIFSNLFPKNLSQK